MDRPAAALLRRATPAHGEPISVARVLAPAVLIAIGYYGGSVVGFWLRFPGSGISFFWPPTAVLTAALLSTATRYWLGLFAGALVAHAIAHVQDGVPVGAWMVQFLGNGVQAALAVTLVRRFSRPDPFLADTRSVVAFVLGACVAAPALASLIPASVYVSLGWASSLRDAWVARTVTNVVASLTLIPSLTVAIRFLLSGARRIPARLAEFGVVLAAIAAGFVATSYFARADVFGLSITLFAPTPFLLWAIVRFGIPGLSFALLWTALAAIASASAGHASFIADTTARTVLGVQLFLSGNAILMMLIASLLESQRAEHARLLASSAENAAILGRLRETQQRYELATAAGGVGVWELEVRTGAIHVLGNLKALIGYRDDEIRDTLAAWMALVWSADRPEVQSSLDAFTSGATSTYDVEFRMCHRDGTLRWIAAKGAITDTSGGRPTHVRGTYTDVTERKESERALREATDALARTSRLAAMTELSASLAHELNQPLTAIVANVNACVRWIDAGASMDEISEAMRDVLSESHRASQIVARTRGLFANHLAEPTLLNVNDVVRDVVDLATARLRESHVVLDLRLANDPASAVADSVQMQQVLLNLIVNANEAMRDAPAHRRRLRIRTRRCREGLIIDVRDTGRGFPHEDRERLFEPFFTTKPGGTGMGLSISRSIMQRHHGSLYAMANTGDGATFRIRMPTASG